MQQSGAKEAAKKRMRDLRFCRSCFIYSILCVLVLVKFMTANTTIAYHFNVFLQLSDDVIYFNRSAFII